MSLRRIAYAAPEPSLPRGGAKTQNGCFSSKSAILSKEVCYKLSLCEKRQRQSYKAFIGLSICPLLCERLGLGLKVALF